MSDMILAAFHQCAARSRFALPSPLKWHTTSPGSEPDDGEGARTAREKARSHFKDVIDLRAADIMPTRSPHCLSRVTRSCEERRPV